MNPSTTISHDNHTSMDVQSLGIILTRHSYIDPQVVKKL